MYGSSTVITAVTPSRRFGYSCARATRFPLAGTLYKDLLPSLLLYPLACTVNQRTFTNVSNNFLNFLIF